MDGYLGLTIAALTIVLNALFVAAEFSLVSLRRPAMEERAAGGDRGARRVVRELEALSFTLSSAQFGITATSLILGFIAEEAIGATIIRPALEAVGLPGAASTGVAVAGALLLSTVVQMVVGELFPKNLAISRPVGVAVAVTAITRPLGIALGPIIRVFDRAAAWMTRRVFGVEVIDELESGHSLAELARIVTASGEEGALSAGQTTLLRRAITLSEARAGRVMVPRPDVVWLEASDTLADLRDRARDTGHSRFPVRDGDDDHVLGSVHVKDLFGRDRAALDQVAVTEVVQPLLTVPESQPLRQLLAGLRHGRRTFAVVVDEFGATAGIVTVEDVLEVLVGDIHDEFDDVDGAVRELPAGTTAVAGSLQAERLAELLDTELPEGPYETVAGLVLDRLGRLATVGDHVLVEGATLTVTGVDGVRITEVTVVADPPVDGEVAP